MKSTTFTGHLTGSAQIRALKSGLTSVDSGVLTVIIDTGLVAHYQFNGDVNDTSGNANNGTVYGGATYSEDWFGNPNGALVFDVVDDYVELPNESNFDLTTWSIAAIVKVPDYPVSPNKYAVISKGEDFGNYTLHITGPDGLPYITWEVSGGNYTHWVANEPVPVDKFVHIAVTYDWATTRLKGYINGVPKTDVTLPGYRPLLNNEQATIGVSVFPAPTPWQYFKGAIDDLRIYDRVLTEGEVAELYLINHGPIEEWVTRYDGPANSTDYASAFVVDSPGNVYVTGSSVGSGTLQDYATIKYNNSGVQQWVARYDGPGNSSDTAEALVVDSSGNVYVTGSSVGSGTGRDYATIKYNNNGVQQWVARYNGPASEYSYDYAFALAVDSSGNVYVTGHSAGSGTGDDYATIKYNNSGVEQWVARYNGPGNSTDSASALVVDSPGNVYVTGYSAGSGTGWDYATIKYNNSGVQEWVARYNGPGNGIDDADALTLDSSGSVYVTGRSAGISTGLDYATIKYDSSGNQLWMARHNGPGNGGDDPYAINVDSSGNVYVTGGSVGSGTLQDYATIKYRQ